MTWLRLDDAYPDHPKVLPLSDAAFRLDVTAKCWAAARATDGLITRSDLKVLAAKLEAPRGVARVVDNLVASGLWEVSGEGWKLHDWLDYNPSAKEVAADRAAAAERMRKLREKKKCSPEQSPNERGTNGARSGEVRSSRPVPSSCSKEQDPPKSPTGDLPGLKIDKPLPPGFWQRFVARAGNEWGLPERFAKSCEAIGAIVPGREQAQLLAGALEAQQAGYSEQDFMKLADFIAAGGVGWRGAAWQHVSKNFVAELSKALAWDGVSDPRQRTPTAKAPPQLPQSPQPPRAYAETTAKRQADAIERGDLPEVDPTVVAAELRRMREATT